jgi:hypothetical protein
MKEHLNTNEVAELLGISGRTLERWRSLRCGSPLIKQRGFVRYRRRDLDAGMNEGIIHPHSESCSPVFTSIAQSPIEHPSSFFKMALRALVGRKDEMPFRRYL